MLIRSLTASGEISPKPTGLVLSSSENGCTPTCVAGMYHRYKAAVALSAPTTINDTNLFTKVRVVFPGVSDQSNRRFNLD